MVIFVFFFSVYLYVLHYISTIHPSLFLIFLFGTLNWAHGPHTFGAARVLSRGFCRTCRQCQLHCHWTANSEDCCNGRGTSIIGPSNLACFVAIVHTSRYFKTLPCYIAVCGITHTLQENPGRRRVPFSILMLLYKTLKIRRMTIR